MKNSNYFPFERNRYFYGKLLSVDDFELEQKYMNDKRRMINRFLFGAGIVAGLCVVEVDEQTVSVEAGIALDSWGREIVVDVPVARKLSFIDGFEECHARDRGFMYLCLEYEEEETDKAHNIAGTVSAAEGRGDLSYNKIREGYHLFLTDCEPEGDIISPSGWHETAQTIYRDEDIWICQSIPKYIKAGGQAQLKVTIENHGRSNISLSYSLELNRLLSEGKSLVKVTFDEVLFERTGCYEITYPLQAADMAGEEATATVDASHVSLRLSGAEQKGSVEGEMAARLVKEEAAQAVQREYYQTSMDRLGREGYRQAVYLAKLCYINAAETCMIDRIERVPFGQYVSNQAVNTALYQIMDREIAVLRRRLEKRDSGDEAGDRPGEGQERLKIARGVAEISVEGKGQRGEKFFSREIVHGLGLGKVFVAAGLEREPGNIVYGAQEIFEPEGAAEVAASVNEGNGSFVIGIRLLHAVQGRLRVHWTAVRDGEEDAFPAREKRLFIKPNLLELHVRQSYSLEAVCENMADTGILWSVRDEGGVIDEGGRYTAPNTAGVYEVTAQSRAFPEMRASVFVVVRDTDAEEVHSDYGH